MQSIRHIAGEVDVSADPYLDAARDSILAVGWRRTTLTDVARLAGVSRMTLYRRFADMPTLLGDLMTREWTRMVAAVAPRTDTPPSADDVAALVCAMVRALRDDPLFTRILDVDPELLLPYLLDRRGRSQDLVLGLLAAGLADGQAAGTVRAGDPGLLARAVLLTAHGFALSAPTMTEPEAPATDALDDELRRIVAAYLAP